jgi:hypothetical protein
MRPSIRDRVGLEVGDHVGLAYTTLAPVDQGGKVPDDAKDRWLANLAAIAIVPDYRAHVDAWIASFARTSARLFTLTLDARLLIGHGNASGTDVGLTVHHTWGVPIVPGSALKGTLAHHVATTYGSDPSVTTTTPDPAHDPWRGVGWADTAIARGPGELYRALFGAPDADDDRAADVPGATRGYVVFHDALYLGVASPVREAISPAPESTRPFAADTGDGRMIFEELNRSAEKPGLHSHIAVNHPDIPPPAVLESELCPRPAGPIFGLVELDYHDRISLRGVACVAVGERDVDRSPLAEDPGVD